MKLIVSTIVLDGMPWITWHLPMLNRLRGIDWEWHVMEGVAAPMHCTRWCSKIEPRVSGDGTTQYLDSIASHPRVRIYRKPLWLGKIEMVNRPLKQKEPYVLLQADADELWTTSQVESIHWLLTKTQWKAAQFSCRFFVGPHIAVTERGGYGNRDSEWMRAWRMEPGMLFERHEPPVVRGHRGIVAPPTVTKDIGLVFDHYAYATEAQVAFKERFYKYEGATAAWKRMQRYIGFPAPLNQFLPWVDTPSKVELVV